jgi:hypothetical protein
MLRPLRARAVLTHAQRGDPRYEHFASAGELLGELITADGAVPSDVDSIVQSHGSHSARDTSRVRAEHVRAEHVRAEHVRAEDM